MYFDSLPKITYTFTDGRIIELEMADIFRRVVFKEDSRNNDSNFELYVVKDGETPDKIALNFYNDSKLWWLVLMFNNIIDVENEWPKSVSEVYRMTENFLKGDSYFIFESLDVKENDILVKRDITQTGSIDINSFGIVDSYDPFLHKIDVKRSKGTINSNDEFYIFRGNVDDGYVKIEGFGGTSCAPQYSGSTHCTQITGPGPGPSINGYGIYCPTGGSTFGIIRKKTTINGSVIRFEYDSDETNPYSGIVDGGPSGSFYSTENMCGLTSSILYLSLIHI